MNEGQTALTLEASSRRVSQRVGHPKPHVHCRVRRRGYHDNFEYHVQMMNMGIMERVSVTERFMRLVHSLVLLIFGTCSVAAETESVHWDQFRGPNGTGTAAGFKPPLEIVANQAA